MQRKPWRLLALLTALATFILAVGSPTANAAPPGSGSSTIRVTINAPEGVPGAATLTSRTDRFVATKPVLGTTITVDVQVPSGQYDIQGEPVIVDGKRYVARSTPRSVSVQVGGMRATTVTYELSKGVQSVTIDQLGETSTSFTVDSPAGNEVVVRRTEGKVAAQKQGEGVAVPISGRVVVDQGLKPGTQYNYSFFAKPGDSAFGVDQASGPYVVTVGTSGGPDMVPTFVVKPQTLIAEQSQVESVAPSGTGLRVTFAAGVPVLVPGAAVILPISSTLEGGYLGVIESVEADGRTVILQAGGLLDAFDFYRLDVPDIAAVPQPAVATTDSGQAVAGAAERSAKLPRSKQEEARAMREGRQPGVASGSKAVEGAAPSVSAKGAQVAPLASKAGLGKCTTSGKDAVEFTPSLTPGGHFNIGVNKGLFDLPKGLTLDSSVTVTAKGEVTAETSAAIECGLNLPEIKQQIVVTPVPIAFVFTPEVKVSLSAAAKLSGVGAQVTTGFEVKGSAQIGGDGSFDAKRILKSELLKPKAEFGAHLGFSAGGTGTVGPGAGTKLGGVLVGLGINLVLVDGDVSLTVSNNAPICFTFNLGGNIGLVLNAKAWLGNFEQSKSWQLLGGSFTYPGFPKTYPDGCDKPIQGPGDSVIGTGVTKVGDAVVGSPLQSGYLDGFAPGAKAWVLSTGQVSQAVGSPSYFASSQMGMPGDADLSVLAGRPTYDASSYSVTVVPSGTTLKVKYVFASEEYPEWVGSSFNDVMAVYVNGQNCALVPGTNTPVSVNTINAGSNSQYYVDNQTGASGYGTTMDGLTTPLTCSVPVTPGQPVQVRLTVADASDSVLDSAVALLDKGIWSE